MKLITQKRQFSGSGILFGALLLVLLVGCDKNQKALRLPLVVCQRCP